MSLGRRKHLKQLAALALAPALGAARAVRAEAAYPSKPIRFIAPFSAGGAVDLMTRLLAEQLAKQMNTPVLVENRVGANGAIGTELVINAPPDGYTILMCYDGTLSIKPAVSPVTYDVLRDLMPVTEFVNSPGVIGCTAKVPVKTFADLQAYAKANNTTFATSGAGSAPHLVGEFLKVRAGVPWTHVPYKGAGQAVADVIGGHVTCLIAAVSTIEPYVRSGELSPIAVNSNARSPLLPETPTLVELGIRDAPVDSWFGVFAPVATPRPIVDRLNHEIVAALHDEAFLSKLKGLSFTPVGNTPEEFRDHIRTDMARWVRVAREANIHIDM